MSLSVRDPRTGRNSDMLVGRDCSHYSMYVETQASVLDGYAWQDNGDGTFTWTERSKRYSHLDLYGMGLLAPDEVPPFFYISDIPGAPYPKNCREYPDSLGPRDRTVTGKRIDLSIEDVVAASGERLPTSDDRQDYWRDAQVVVTSLRETAQSDRPRQLAERIDRARLYWEEWNQRATQNRMVICTKTTADCGDPRSDVTALRFDSAARAPASGPLRFAVAIGNGGGRAATGVRVMLEVTVDTGVLKQTRDLGTLQIGSTRDEIFDVDLSAVSCGAEVQVKAAAQSDHHYSRKKERFLVGVESRVNEDFEAESGWTVNPEGTDTRKGATWQRGQPEKTTLLDKTVQPGAVQGGMAAWVTGLAAKGAGERLPFVINGEATLESPLYSVAGLREPRLRYWVSFAGVQGDPGGAGIEPSPLARMVVLMRGVGADAGVDGRVDGGPGVWTQVDLLENRITRDWEQRTIVLPAALLGTGRVQFRFVAHDANPEQGAVEAAIDTLQIVSNLPGCDKDAIAGTPSGEGCACHLGGPGGGRRHAPWALWVGLLAVAISCRRRGIFG
jgi:hypothetical protein